MANEKVISSKALIAKFQYALDNNWGYIYGIKHQLWSKAKQDDYRKAYGNDPDRKLSCEKGDKWIGHWVTDCSGLFAWAFDELGRYIAHGSNSIWDKYCSSKGTLKNGKTGSGKELKPGTAVFTSSGERHNHIGLYIGNGTVIEAQGTIAGVITSKVTNKKWTHWGELKGVDYGKTEEAAKPVEDNQGFPDHSVWHATVRRGSKGIDVTDLQTYLYKLGYDIGPDGIDGDFGRNTEKAVREFQRDHLLTVDGVCGPMTWDALEKAVQSISETPKIQLYTVSIHHLDKTQAEAMRNNYPGSTVTEE